MKLKYLTWVMELRIETFRALRQLLLVLVGALPGVVQAQDFTCSSDGNENTITEYTGAGGAAAIPSMIENLPVTRIGYNAFNHKTSVTSVVIPDSVKTIGILAFAYCSGLTSANIPGSVTNIGYSAFAQPSFRNRLHDSE